MGESIKQAISGSLKAIKSSRSLETAMMADLLDIPTRTLEGYLYAQSTPSLGTVIQICNQFNYPINDFFESLIEGSTEQQPILEISASIHSLTEWKRNQIFRVITPIMQSMSQGFPSLENADLGQKIRVLRKDMNTSMGDIAKICKISSDTLKGIESSQHLPGILLFIKLCNLLHVSPEYLLYRELTYPLNSKREFYSLTPRQITALSDSVHYLCDLVKVDSMS